MTAALRFAFAAAGAVCTVWFQTCSGTAYGQNRIVLQDNRIVPASMTFRMGETVQLEVVNAGTKAHNLVIPAFYVFTYNLTPGESVSVSFAPAKTGSFPYYSDTGGRPEPGLRGTLTITP